MAAAPTTSGPSTSPASPSPFGAVVDTQSVPVHGFDRLRSARDVTTTLRRGHHRAGRVAVLHVRDGIEGPARLTFVASRKVGSAVRRNRAKRLLREAARCVSWREGHDIVLVARAATAEAGLAEVIEDVRHLADQLDLVVTP